MSADHCSTYRTASKPPLQLWESFAARLFRFFDLKAEEKLVGAPAIADEISPFVHWAVFDLARRHALLIDEGNAHRLLFSHVIGLKRVPAHYDLFILQLQSVALKQVIAERTATISSLTCTQPAWTGFRNRFNNLQHADRALLLETLPSTSLTSTSSEARTLPGGHSLKLWRAISSGVPQSALPVEWQRFASENTPEEVQRIEALLKPEIASSFVLPNIILSRESSAKTVKKLGRWLFRAAATQEQRLGDSSEMELILPAWVIPKSRVQFLDDLSGIILDNGGVPCDSKLRDVVLQSKDCLEGGLWLPNTLCVKTIIDSLHDLGEMPCNTSALFGLHLARLHDSAGAEMAYSRQLNQATKPSEVATALSNLAGMRIKHGNLDEASTLLREALLLNPWSKVATGLLSWLHKAIAASGSENSNAR
jgi:hypothetical protein